MHHLLCSCRKPSTKGMLSMSPRVPPSSMMHTSGCKESINRRNVVGGEACTRINGTGRYIPAQHKVCKSSHSGGTKASCWVELGIRNQRLHWDLLNEPPPTSDQLRPVPQCYGCALHGFPIACGQRRHSSAKMQSDLTNCTSQLCLQNKV